MYIPRGCGECVCWNPRTYTGEFRRPEEPLCARMKTIIMKSLEDELKGKVNKNELQ